MGHHISADRGVRRRFGWPELTKTDFRTPRARGNQQRGPWEADERVWKRQLRRRSGFKSGSWDRCPLILASMGRERKRRRPLRRPTLPTGRSSRRTGTSETRVARPIAGPSLPLPDRGRRRGQNHPRNKTPMKTTSEYLPIDSIPRGVRMDIDRSTAGQIVTTSYGGWSRAEHGYGDPYMQERDGSDGSVRSYRLTFTRSNAA